MNPNQSWDWEPPSSRSVCRVPDIPFGPSPRAGYGYYDPSYATWSQGNMGCQELYPMQVT